MPYKANVVIQDVEFTFARGDVIPDGTLSAKDLEHFLKIGAIAKHDATPQEVKAAKEKIDLDKTTPAYAVRHQAASVVKAPEQKK